MLTPSFHFKSGPTLHLQPDSSFRVGDDRTEANLGGGWDSG